MERARQAKEQLAEAEVERERTRRSATASFQKSRIAFADVVPGETTLSELTRALGKPAHGDGSEYLWNFQNPENGERLAIKVNVQNSTVMRAVEDRNWLDIRFNLCSNRISKQNGKAKGGSNFINKPKIGNPLFDRILLVLLGRTATRVPMRAKTSGACWTTWLSAAVVFIQSASCGSCVLGNAGISKLFWQYSHLLDLG